MTASELFHGIADADFVKYHVELSCRGWLVGGVPSEAGVVRAWLRARLEMDDTHLEELAQEVIEARDTALTVDEKIDALMTTDAVNINGFKRQRDTKELIYEGRCMKGALKEFASSAYPGTQWPGRDAVSKRVGGYRKGLKSTAAEWINIPELEIPLGVYEPTEIQERVKHVSTPQGPRSAINTVEVVWQPRIVFTLVVLDDFLPEQSWARIWQLGEMIGIGADRARGDGTFNLEVFDRLN